MAGGTTPDAFVPSAYYERIHCLPRSSIANPHNKTRRWPVRQSRDWIFLLYRKLLRNVPIKQKRSARMWPDARGICLLKQTASGTQSVASPSKIEGCREFEADLSALFYVKGESKWRNRTGKENIMLFSVTENVNIFRAMQAQIRRTLTVCSATVRCMHWEINAVGISEWPRRELKTARTASYRTKHRITAT